MLREREVCGRRCVEREGGMKEGYEEDEGIGTCMSEVVWRLSGEWDV